MLKGYIAPTKAVPLPGATDPMLLRGLSLHDIAAVVRLYRSDIDTVFKQFEGLISGRGIENLDIGNVITVAMQTAPAMVSYIIACAADEPDAADVVGKLPVTTQLAAMTAIGDLTFEGEGGAKNVLDAVLRMIGGVGSLIRPAGVPRTTRGPQHEIRVGSDGTPMSEPV